MHLERGEGAEARHSPLKSEEISMRAGGFQEGIRILVQLLRIIWRLN
jgi:hypothetical protein